MENINKLVFENIINIASTINNSSILNEKYIHHYFTRLMQESFSKIDLVKINTNKLFPEWPTYNKFVGNEYARYHYDQKKKNFFKQHKGYSGYIDFAIGSYNSPDIGVEFTLEEGWYNEAVIFDFLKLLDYDNPFKTVFSLNIIMRKKDLTKGKALINFEEKINQTLLEVRNRLNDNIDNNKEYHFIISEISNNIKSDYNERRHWYHSNLTGGWLEGENLPDLINQKTIMGQLKLF
ncbi:MAG: hypothetical protein AB1782_15935 [Cyanobacteriota bacterium]